MSEQPMTKAEAFKYLKDMVDNLEWYAANTWNDDLAMEAVHGIRLLIIHLLCPDGLPGLKEQEAQKTVTESLNRLMLENSEGSIQ